VASNPSFIIYCLFAAVLCINMLGLWAYSGAVRAGTKTTPNSEDAGNTAKGATVTDATPDAVGRVLRVHRNANDNIIPFLILGLIYVLLGATPRMAWIAFGTFTAARLAHTFVYLAGKQPWRTIFFVLGQLVTLGVVVQILRSVVHAL
jgi:prostaglandin-E synthase 1